MCLEAVASSAAAGTMSSSGGQQQQSGRQTPPKVEPEQQQQQQAEDKQQQQQQQQKASSSASTGSPVASRSPSPMEYPTDASVLKERYSQHMHDPDSSQDMDNDSLGATPNTDTEKASSKYMNCLEEMEMNPFVAAGLARHRYSMFGAAAVMSQDTSKLLRGILQSKEKRLSGAPLDPEEQEMYAKMQERAALLRHTSFDTDFDSMPSGTPGDISEDSDQENQVGENNYNENSMSDDGKEKSSNSENGDVTEVKRARVDSIINSLHMSPYKPLSELSQGELRRPKRKQYIPQQHDSRNMEEPSPKVRKVEEEAFKSQLKFMQQQLSEMQQKYFELLDHNGHPINGTEEVKKPSFTINGIMGSRDDIVKPSPIASLAEVAHNLEPSHFFKTANKMVKEQEMSGKTPETAAELDHLAKMLKQEISSNINVLVDSIVAKFIEKQKTVKKVTEKPLVNNNNNNITTATQNNVETIKDKALSRTPTPDERDHHKDSGTPKPPRTKVTDKILPPMLDIRPRLFHDFPRHPLFPPPPYFGHLAASMPIFPAKEPEQTEPMSLVISTPKKKRTKVTDTRLSPRAARALLQDCATNSPDLQDRKSPHPLQMMGHYGPHHPALGGDFPGSLVPVTLPTSVAIPNPSLQHSEVLAMYSHAQMSHADHPHHHHHHHHNGFHVGSEGRPLSQSPLIGDNGSPNTAHTPSDNLHSLAFKTDSSDFHHSFAHHSHLGSLDDSGYDGMQVISFFTTTLTPMHLRKAKLMFFYVRYPSSAIIKMYFPDVKFNKNNTAQLVKWFSNFREFYYIQMEKYARQALAEGVKSPDDLVVTTDSELYRVLNLHYNRNNQIEVPESFSTVIEQTLREFYKAVQAGKDTEQSWKKSIYKVIARLDDQIPEYFKSPNWMETLNDM